MENMKTAELKQIAKELKVKNWWLLNKEQLIKEIQALQQPKEEKPQLKKPNLKIKEITYKGRTQTIREWATELEMPWPTLYDRINRNGWSVEEAIEIPLGGRRSKAQKESV